MFWEKYKKIAHRGLHADNIPENSMTAFNRAIENNYAIELDVRMTKDNVMLVFHDANLYRMTGVDKEIENCNYSEIANLRLNGTKEKIPTLKEVLRLVNGAVGIIIEVKNMGRPGKLEKELVRILKTYKGHYMIQSFNMLTLIWFKNNAPKIPRGKLSARNNSGFFDKFSNFLMYTSARPNFISYKYEDVNFSTINICRLFGIKLFVWTIRGKDEFKKSTKKYKGVIFENV